MGAACLLGGCQQPPSNVAREAPSAERASSSVGSPAEASPRPIAAPARTADTPPPVSAAPAAASVVTPGAEPVTRYLFGWGEVPLKTAQPRGGTSRGAEVVLAPPRELPLPAIAQARSEFEQDRAAILSLAGNYRVSFHFLETIGLTGDYVPRSPYHSWATEQVRVLADTGRFISLQHTLVMFFQDSSGQVSPPSLVKHWRQDWTYEDKDLHTFRGNQTWARRTLSDAEAAGTWSQAVFQVDDSPRYESFGFWEHRGNVSIWTGSREMRPLPRRELTVRKDYGVMEGSHRIVLTPTGWVHEQQNWKRVAGDQAETPRYLAQEYGLDRYERIVAPSLAAADDYWRKTGDYWDAVRRAWSAVLAKNDRFSLRTEVDGKKLFEWHFEDAEKFEQGEPYSASALERRVKATLDRFVQAGSD